MLHNTNKKQLRQKLAPNCFCIVNSYKTRFELKKMKIKNLSIHDCFLVELKNYEKLLKIYNKNLNNIDI